MRVINKFMNIENKYTNKNWMNLKKINIYTWKIKKNYKKIGLYQRTKG